MTKGLDAILANLTKLQVNCPRKAKEAVTDVANKFKDRLSDNTPIEEMTIEHLKDDTVVSGFKGASEGIISKDIGYGKATGWRAHFPDDGTIYQKSQNFKEKTINEMTPVAKEIYAQKIKEGLNL